MWEVLLYFMCVWRSSKKFLEVRCISNRVKIADNEWDMEGSILTLTAGVYEVIIYLRHNIKITGVVRPIKKGRLRGLWADIVRKLCGSQCTIRLSPYLPLGVIPFAVHPSSIPSGLS